MEQKDHSYLELEETLIPYPDSLDFDYDNEKKYILRLETPFRFETQILLSRFTPYDNEDYSSLQDRSGSVIQWFHSTVYNYEESVLEKNSDSIRETTSFRIGFLLNQLSKNKSAAEEMLFYNDLILVSANKYYRYILTRNQLLFRGTLGRQALSESVIDRDEWTDKAEELLVILTHPRRGAYVWGEHSYQKALVSAGELRQLVQMLGSMSSSIGLRLHECFYDFDFLQQLGIEDGNSVPTAVFECHSMGVENE